AERAEVEALEIRIAETLLRHPAHEVVHARSGPGPSGELEIHDAVLARPRDPHERAGAHLAIRALAGDDGVVHGPRGERIRERARDGFLARDIYVLPEPGTGAMGERDHGAGRRGAGAVQPEVREPDPYRR